jgi:hypothetical protein
MSDEQKKHKLPEHLEEKHIVVKVPPGVSKKEIEEEIHKALAQEPPDFLVRSPSKQMIIVVQVEGNRPPPKPSP